MDNYIDLKKLNLDELVGVVNLYPWFGGDRKKLCERMTGAWGEGRYLWLQDGEAERSQPA